MKNPGDNALIQTLNCPSCGAPLHIEPDQVLTICLYCNSTVRITYSEADKVETTAEASIPADLLNEVKQLLLSGRQSEAIELYREESGVSLEEASKMLQSLGTQLSAGIIRRQQLNVYGILVAILDFILLVTSAAAGLTGAVSPVLAWGAFVIALFIFWLYGRGLIVTLRFSRARTAPATVLKIAPIGKIKTSSGPIYTFRVLLEVRPHEGSPFQTEMNLPVRGSNLAKLHPEAVIQVKYLPTAPQDVVFDKRLSEG